MRMIKMQRLQPHIFGKKAAPKKVEPKGNAPKPSTTDGKPEQVGKQNGKK